MDCPTCQSLGDVVAKTSRDWAFAEQLAEVSGSMPELIGPARRKADAVREEYDLAVRTLSEHRDECLIFRSKAANSASGAL